MNTHYAAAVIDMNNFQAPSPHKLKTLALPMASMSSNRYIMGQVQSTSRIHTGPDRKGACMTPLHLYSFVPRSNVRELSSESPAVSTLGVGLFGPTSGLLAVVPAAGRKFPAWDVSCGGHGPLRSIRVQFGPVPSCPARICRTPTESDDNV